LTAAAAPSFAGRRLAIPLSRVENGALWLIGFTGFIAFIEPSPNDLCVLLGMGVLFLTGLKLSRLTLLLAGLLFLYLLGAAISLVQVLDDSRTLTWTLVGIFLGLSAVFFASAMAENTEARLQALLHGLVTGALVASLIGILAYFRLMPGSDQFLLYERARSTFKDPNLFGPYLVLPALLLLQNVFARGAIRGFPAAAALVVILGALFLSFSRGAWGHFVVSAAIMTLLTFATTTSQKERWRIVGLSLAGLAVLGMMLVALLSIGSVEQLFEQRATLDQAYDEGRLGRFGRHILGFQLALDKPIGIGMLQFPKYFPEDPHNTYLNAFMSYGWLGGVVFPALVISTLFIGIQALRIATPWRPALICIFATFAACMGEAWIIDVDHWRHVYLLLGLIWGLGAASLHWRDATLPRQI